jgi:hypothetical protein
MTWGEFWWIQELRRYHHLVVLRANGVHKEGLEEVSVPLDRIWGKKIEAVGENRYNGNLRPSCNNENEGHNL